MHSGQKNRLSFHWAADRGPGRAILRDDHIGHNRPEARQGAAFMVGSTNRKSSPGGDSVNSILKPLEIRFHCTHNIICTQEDSVKRTTIWVAVVLAIGSGVAQAQETDPCTPSQEVATAMGELPVRSITETGW